MNAQTKQYTILVHMLRPIIRSNNNRLREWTQNSTNKWKKKQYSNSQQFNKPSVNKNRARVCVFVQKSYNIRADRIGLMIFGWGIITFSSYGLLFCQNPLCSRIVCCYRNDCIMLNITQIIQRQQHHTKILMNLWKTSMLFGVAWS